MTDGQLGAPHYGGPPVAAVDRPVVRRPGMVVSAAVLAFIQSGLTAITTLVMVFVAMGRTGTHAVIAHTLWGLQFIAMEGLVAGGVLLLLGKHRSVIIAGNAIHLLLSLLWIGVAVWFPGTTLDPEDPSGAKGGLVLIAIAFSVLPLVSLIQAGAHSTGAWLRFRSGRY
ncbi:hypothetical protein SAMN05192558_101386 [Actinokineospora alba]|uniref:Uncharacterized protein n=1 Tax=Actinokineospora alba TaxID=504798 RepID=A0A1H0FIH6_9PSEU|nr:hypothetical protein [Actinokineospora alba]TDP69494.1 hypothetical protein C8E96_5082 [Actinokineospora alba]SDI15508.1 hypothetical protein SAMN05421871_103484 [Actinokineospora alba]SDN94477.1 hypothetical protein SAMN05192558_101386 [Actinokineospora alba]